LQPWMTTRAIRKTAVMYNNNFAAPAIACAAETRLTVVVDQCASCSTS